MKAEKLISQMVVDIGVRIPMRDGVELVGDIYRPAHDGRWPVLLLRCPYDRLDPAMGSMVIVDPAWLARQGFVVVVQDVRGRGESEGDFDMVYQEVDDGYDTVEWAAVQSWSNGAVGIYGSSYMGITTYQAVGARPPHLRAAIAFIASTQGVDKWVHGGIFDACFLTWYAYLTVMMTVSRSAMEPEEKAGLLARIVAALTDPVATSAQLPLSALDVISDPTLAPFWPDFLCDPKRADRSDHKLLGDHQQVGDVALLHITGYRDLLANPAFELATALAENTKHRFIAGPWTHRGPYSGFTGSREFPGTSTPAGPLGWGPLIAAWFDIHLRGGTGANYPLGLAWLQGEPVRYYLEGENRWESTQSWPPLTKACEWHLDSNGNARSTRGDGRILQPGKLAADNRSDRLAADPHNPFPTCGGAFGIPEQGPEGVQDQRAVDQRNDVLVYTSDVLDNAVRIAGAQQLVLQFSSTAPDADICVTLVDVEPSGFAYNVSEGFQRTRYRRGGATDWLEPGKVEEVTIALHNTAHVFKPGHRIRIMVAGASHPRLSRNLHTKTVPEFGTLAEAVVAEHEINHGPQLRSRLVLNQVDG